MLKNPSRVLAADERRFTQIENSELDPILSAFICVYPRLRSVFQQPARPARRPTFFRLGGTVHRVITPGRAVTFGRHVGQDGILPGRLSDMSEAGLSSWQDAILPQCAQHGQNLVG